LAALYFLGESHPRAEHRNFLLDLHADRLRRRTVDRCPKIVNGEIKEILGRCPRFGVRCVRALVQTSNGSTFGVLIEPSLRSGSCVQRERNAEMAVKVKENNGKCWLYVGTASEGHS
jgi:hypothetical protein